MDSAKTGRQRRFCNARVRGQSVGAAPVLAGQRGAQMPQRLRTAEQPQRAVLRALLCLRHLRGCEVGRAACVGDDKLDLSTRRLNLLRQPVAPRAVRWRARFSAAHDQHPVAGRDLAVYLRPQRFGIKLHRVGRRAVDLRGWNAQPLQRLSRARAG